MKTLLIAGVTGAALVLTGCGPATEAVCTVGGVVVDDSQCQGENPSGVSVEIDIDRMKNPPHKGQKIPAGTPLPPGAPVKTLPKYTPAPPAKVAPAPAPPRPAPAVPAPKPPAKSGK